MVKVESNEPENWTNSPGQYEKQMGKFRAKGFICFEEITDYSTLDSKVQLVFSFALFFKLCFNVKPFEFRLQRSCKKSGKLTS